MSKKNNSIEGLDIFRNLDVHLPTRTIYLGSEIDHETSSSFVKNMHILSYMSKEPITIILNSIGGEVVEGYAIYDTIKLSECHITIKVVGNAMSMGAIILQAADVRLMSPHSSLMIHYGSDSIKGSAMHIRRWAEDSKKWDEVQEDILLAKIQSKIPEIRKSGLRKLLEHDTILTAPEALEYNLIDGIIGVKDGK